MDKILDKTRQLKEAGKKRIILCLRVLETVAITSREDTGIKKETIRVNHPKKT